jgi:hypothetical protein
MNKNNGNTSFNFVGVYESQGKEIQCSLVISDSYIKLKALEITSDLDLVIPYKNLVYFATLQDRDAIIIDYNLNSNTDELTNLFYFTPNDKAEGI